jgi:cytochrome c peroxidase
MLRGLAARAPYFHGGTAANLAQVVAFYNARYSMALTPQQQSDLVNFLHAL